MASDSDDQQRRAERLEFLQRVADEAFASGTLPSSLVVLRGPRIPALVKGYFVLSDVYKRWRIQSGHYTEPHKIAALQAMAIMSFLPFSPVSPDNVTSVAEVKCNEIYALNCATAILGFSIEQDTPAKEDFWLRLFDVLTKCVSITLQPMVDDYNRGLDRAEGEYEVLTVHDGDKLAINSLITIFELLGDKFRPQSTFRRMLGLLGGQ